MALDDAWTDQQVWAGVTSLLDHYAHVQSTDTVVVLYTSLTREAAAILSVALQLRDIEFALVRMAVLHDDTLRQRLSHVLPLPADLRGRLILFTLERDTFSHGGVLRDVLGRYEPQSCIIVRAISVCPDFFSKSLSPSPSDLSARNTAILSRGMAAGRLRIETPSGSRLEVTLDNERYQWISNRGSWTPGRFVILPAGEVATFPASIDGTLIADSAYNTNLARSGDARLSTPVTITIVARKAVDCHGGDPGFVDFLTSCFEDIENFRTVGELGFGTNWGVDAPIALNSHINERQPGVHLGFGDHNQRQAAAGYACPVHIDLIARGGRIWFDDDPVPLDLDAIVPSSRPHPTRFRDDDLRTFGETVEEELEGQCCGTSGQVVSEGLSAGT
jgi:hypothetical protein